MDKYLKRQVIEFLMKIQSRYRKLDGADRIARDAISEAISDVYSLDLHADKAVGRWNKISPAGIYECSECGKNVMTSDIDAYQFCHGCGTRMLIK